MACVKMTNEQFRSTVAELMQKYRVVAPVMVEGKKEFAPLTDVALMVLDDELSYKSPKEVVFPRVEKIMEFTDEGAKKAQESISTLLIGATPCDLDALRVLDHVFTGEKGKYVDSFYKNNREHLTIVGMACQEKKRACFCDLRGIDMSYSDACDAFLRRDGDMITLCVLTDKAEGLFKGESAEEFEKHEKLPALLEITADEAEVYDAMPWEEYVEGCIGCGACTYICPTCHCFEFRDLTSKAAVNRYRCWDSCMYPKFTLQASGHNPRAAKKERYRQRVLHKYVYIRKNFGDTACTGCGRCIRSCPGGVNIRKTVQDINNRLEEAKKDDQHG